MRNFKGAAQGAAIPRKKEKRRNCLSGCYQKKKSSAEIDELKEKWV